MRSFGNKRPAAIFAALVVAAFVGAAHAQGRSVAGSSPPDPFTMPLPASTDQINIQTTGVTQRAVSINTAIRNLVLIVAGQSNRTSVNPTLYTPTNNSAIDVLNIYDGAFYAISGALPGTSFPGSPLGPGNIGAREADLVITNNKFDHVYLVPIAVDGTSISDWTGRLSNRWTVAMSRLAARGIVPGLTNVTFAIEWSQGPTDTNLGTSQGTYAAALATVISNAFASGFNGRFFLSPETYFSGTTSSGIAAAQAAAVNNITVYAGYTGQDAIGAGGRADTPGHFNDASAATVATGIYNAMHASGAPF